MQIEFNAFFDEDANVWCASSKAAHIHTSAETKEALMHRLAVIVPDVLENRHDSPQRDVKIIVHWQAMQTTETTELAVA